MSTEKNGITENNLGKRLRTFRLSLGLTQGVFAEKLSITGGYISDIEKGKAYPSGAVISEIISAYPLNRIWLEKGEDPMRREETLGEYTVRTHGTNPVVKSVRAEWKNEPPAPQPQTSEPDQRVAEPPKRMRPEELAAKCGYLLDFFNDALDGDSYAIDGFLEKTRNEYLKADPNYRRWTYQKEAEAAERIKKSRESDPNGSLEVKSANGN